MIMRHLISAICIKFYTPVNLYNTVRYLVRLRDGKISRDRL